MKNVDDMDDMDEMDGMDAMGVLWAMVRAPQAVTGAWGSGGWSGPDRRRGFTLIELLIVIAIIAILALIAVPNMLEAQTRARVARARADLRAVATAIETYRADQGAWPTMIDPVFDGGIKPYLEGSQLKWWYVPDALSTPIAYLASADVRCPFGGDVGRQNDFPDPLWRRYSFENLAELMGKVAQFPVLQAKYGPQSRALDHIGAWRALCIGPDRAWNPMVHYDPTNGTISAGNIIVNQNGGMGGVDG